MEISLNIELRASSLSEAYTNSGDIFAEFVNRGLTVTAANSTRLTLRPDGKHSYLYVTVDNGNFSKMIALQIIEEILSGYVYQASLNPWELS